MASHQQSGKLVTEPYVLEMLREINDVVSRRFVDSGGIAECLVVPLGDGPSYSGPVGCAVVRNEGKTAEEVNRAVPFAALTHREKVDVLDTFIGWDRFREQGLTAKDEDRIWRNVLANKPRSRWLEGTSIVQPLRPECTEVQTRQHER